MSDWQVVLQCSGSSTKQLLYQPAPSVRRPPRSSLALTTISFDRLQPQLLQRQLMCCGFRISFTSFFANFRLHVVYTWTRNSSRVMWSWRHRRGPEVTSPGERGEGGRDEADAVDPVSSQRGSASRGASDSVHLKPGCSSAWRSVSVSLFCSSVFLVIASGHAGARQTLTTASKMARSDVIELL